ncbi:hypothetical protein GQX73_g9522 [Xylaria multiplex]|uniref:Uncharacterized protein n=1 Tax=Xylaria multiplex TaxID=323545 RepID=A0A7C8MLC2_9PEZI|nr:hypothetical protein GQX73_g9522 [Xylaria multiplex]
MVHRYQIGERWGWKKYGKKAQSVRKRKFRPQNDSSDSNEGGYVGSSNESEVSSRDMTSLRTSLSRLFHDQDSDVESLSALKEDNLHVSRCIRLLFRWFVQEVKTPEAQFPPCVEVAETETDIIDTKYNLDVRVFIYFLDRYIRSPCSSSRQDEWDNVAKGTIRFRPIKMIFIMSTLIVEVVTNVVNKAKRTCEEEHPFESPYISNVAEFGINAICLNGWGDEKLKAEFCDAFGCILKDYANYGKAIKSAIRSYGKQERLEAKEELEFGDGEGYHDEPLAAISPLDMQGTDEMFFSF